MGERVLKRQQDRESSLRKRREELGLTQRDIALVLGKTDQTISNWETGLYEPKMTPRETKALCRLLKWTIEELPDDFGAPRSRSAGRLLRASRYGAIMFARKRRSPCPRTTDER